jgi:hypothetical protein
MLESELALPNGINQPINHLFEDLAVEFRVLKWTNNCICLSFVAAIFSIFIYEAEGSSNGIRAFLDESCSKLSVPKSHASR